ncbi:hypothetical protein CBR_g10996 [Chara braunii]|uniref:Myb-like domain-containing protein n=1 Tax=Chara braunii TaxID=69332 RepID=A0A388KPS6_CHABU|nr:hypothetical protein CBR_g10996 [Chara braunii]|eukprot:GBG72061.1 hypothetical protein CBR_g10996 [Chara braunii]
MRDKGYNHKDDQCKNKFSQILEYYRKLKAHERRSGRQSYWDMNKARRKRYNVDFVLKRSWYDIIDLVEKNKDSIDLSNLMDSGADKERLEDEEQTHIGVGEGGVGDEEAATGFGGSTGGSQGTGFEPTLGKRKRGYVSARESGVKSVTAAMRAHTATFTRSDKECVLMRIEATRVIATQQVEARRELMLEDIASRERVVDRMGERVERGYSVLADAIRSLRSSRGSRSGSPSTSDSR